MGRRSKKLENTQKMKHDITNQGMKEAKLKISQLI